MAKPRVFISSTFYDFKQIREDLERFIREMGYEPVRNETGSIPYGKEESPERNAYREVELSDIIVSIIGGRFGSESTQNDSHSISMEELKTALDRDVQVFIFIEKSVLAEFSTYLLNKDTAGIKFRFVDDKRVYEFIDGLHKLPRNNPIASFETSADIVNYLQAQWAGMFQRFLSEQKRLSEYKILQEMHSVSKTLRELVTFLTKERSNKDDAIQGILLANHPAFRRLGTLTNTPYRVFFTNEAELDTWLKSRTWKPVGQEAWDEGSVREWLNAKGDEYIVLKKHIFDDQGRLMVITEDEWDEDWLEKRENVDAEPVVSDDDIPF
jgi:hypothetical protein